MRAALGASSMNPIGSAIAGTCTFRAKQSAGVWSVTKNGVFYGDHLTRAQALQSACSAARRVEILGGRALVLASPGDVVVAHHYRAKA